LLVGQRQCYWDLLSLRLSSHRSRQVDGPALRDGLLVIVYMAFAGGILLVRYKLKHKSR
jgi:hypothetical protein